MTLAEARAWVALLDFRLGRITRAECEELMQLERLLERVYQVARARSRVLGGRRAA